jgi:hypothetical protein
METKVETLGRGATVSESRAGTGRGSWRRWVPIVLVLAIGAGLRSAQYFAQVDMWHDELAVARNVEDRDLTGLLTRPLDHLQVAPVGFLAMLEATTATLGVTEAGLRFGPWLFGLISLLLFWRVAARFAEGTGLLVALALFAVSPALIWYGASAKSYGSDVTVSLLLVWLALRHLESPEDGRRGLLAAGIGALLLLFSFPAVPTAAILAVLLVAAWWRRRPRSSLHPLLALLFGWGAGIAAAGFVASGLVSDTTDAFMRAFHAGRFPPAEISGALAWAARSLYEGFAHSLVFFPPSNVVLVAIVALPLLLGVIGLARLVRRSWPKAAILLAPPVAGLLAAAFHLLPFGQRLGLHAAWPFLVLAGAGLHELAGMATRGWRWIPRSLAAVTGLPLVVIVLLAARPPYHGPSARGVVEELAGQVREGDRIYVYTQARHDMAFYGGRAGLERWVQGELHPEGPRGYLREVDALRGSSRAWFLWLDLDDSGRPQWIRDFLGEIGTKLRAIGENESGSAGAALYDLSDPERLEAASAESFPLPTPVSRPPQGTRN